MDEDTCERHRTHEADPRDPAPPRLTPREASLPRSFPSPPSVSDVLTFAVIDNQPLAVRPLPSLTTPITNRDVRNDPKDRSIHILAG